ncbi:MAG: valine--tRNA ligase [Patescibacteria group bacterium]|nr:valine--tRNA ligase [Patescibacteria group bacterium]MBU2509221.1 valine--tRNA ligase [Patescibacteria group bacterium]
MSPSADKPLSLPKTYDASKVEDAIYSSWEKSGAFKPQGDGEPYCIVLPPPNRTGILHIGHAVMLAIEDLMVRFNRMQGRKTLWIPGTDHAAIATQSKVEAQLVKKGMKNPREELGREKLLEEVTKFAAQSHETITNQVRKMGSSCDWSQEKYTLDEERNKAVNRTFEMMYEDGIIERGDRIVNWDPKMQSNVSDDEIEWIEEKTPFYTFKYGPFEISTARPETKFGDKYVVMHPDDKRYKKYKEGDTFECEWLTGKITATVIKDKAIDMEFGTGVMTITPWHDTTDFEIAERHDLDKEQIIDQKGKLLPISGDFAGMDIDVARPKIVDLLKKKGLLVSTDEDYVHRVATNYRGSAKLEPQIMRQWFVRVNKPFKVRQDTLGKWKKGDRATLKDLMRHAVDSGQTNIVPERFTKVYFHWIDNLRDWCISRQIWFGHRIPVWYKGGDIKVSEKSPGKDWEQDPDTLDTWFSSGLWTFSTLGWPDEKEWKKNREFHPTAVLETGYDILFFWVARMVLMSTYVLGEVPFKDVYLHGLVRDEKGRKMSKSLGNVIDPLDEIKKYGTDAVRLSLIIGTTPGQDTNLSESKIQGYRNFTNKLWNISRFILMQIGDPSTGSGTIKYSLSDAKQNQRATLSDKWILTRLSEVTESVTKKIEKYDFSSAGEELRDFTWGDLADWYLEIAKVEKGKEEMLNHILRTILKLWHPFMPFVTESIWQTAYSNGQLITAEWPKSESGSSKTEVKNFELLREIVTVIRRLRADNGIEPAKKLEIVIQGADALKDQQDNIAALARCSKVEFVKEIPKDWVSSSVGRGMVGLNLVGAIDVKKEKAKLEKEIEQTEKYLKTLSTRLSDPEFKKAPKKVVDKMRENKEEAEQKLNALKDRLVSL